MSNVYINYVPYVYGKQNKYNDVYCLEQDKLLNYFKQNSFNNLNIISLKDNYNNKDGISNLQYLYSITNTLKENILKGNKYITISPDHSISIGSIGAKHLQNTCIIWIDAHTDINNEVTSISKNIHGMPLGVLTGRSKTMLNNVPNSYIKDSNIFWLGIRDIDINENKNIQYKDNIYSSSKIKEFGILKCLKDIQNKIQKLNVSNLYISFDIDVLDPSIISSVSTPVPNGLTLEVVDIIFKWLLSLKKAYNIIGIDLVEYDYRYDIGKDYLFCIRLYNKLIKLL